jgi:uncharacterized delta-60 repeat protein
MRLLTTLIFVLSLLDACGGSKHGSPDSSMSGSDGSVDVDAVADSASDVDASLNCQAAGTLDPSFGAGGLVAPIFGLTYGEAVDAVAVKLDASSRIVVAGGFIAGARSCVVARFLPDGSRDSSFGANGIVRYSVGQHVCWFNDVAIQSDGKLIAVGAIDGTTNASRAIIIRFLDDGTVDPTFGDGGSVLFDPPAVTSLIAVAIDANDRIIVVGGTGQRDSRFLTQRYLANGVPDAAFGSGGSAEDVFDSGTDVAVDLSLDSDGRLLVAGDVMPAMGTWDLGIAAYSTAGSRDPAYGANGLVTVGFGEDVSIAGITKDPQGRAVVVGGSQNGAVLTRLGADGSLDMTFGTGGKVTETDHPGVGYGAVATSGDAILVVGTDVVAQMNFVVAVARYTSSGALDPSFGSGGFAATLPAPVSGYLQRGWDLAVQADGRIVVVGGYGNLDSLDMLVARYCP